MRTATEVTADEEQQPRKKSTPAGNAWKKSKKALQSNKVTQPFCPPSGEVATTLTLSLTIIAIFLTARTVLGDIADVGGTVFALLMLIFLALMGGKLIVGFCWLLQRFCNVDLRLPPLLGMLLVGIILKNVPYNFGQFGRAECLANHTFGPAVIDSINFQGSEDFGLYKKKRDLSLG